MPRTGCGSRAVEEPDLSENKRTGSLISILRCFSVNVHVVAAGTSCHAVARSPPMPAYEQRTPLITRVVGAHAPGGAGIHSRARSQSGGLGGDGPAVAGAAATGRAHLVAPPVERSAAGCGETTAAPTHRAPARWASRT